MQGVGSNSPLIIPLDRLFGKLGLLGIGGQLGIFASDNLFCVVFPSLAGANPLVLMYLRIIIQ
jgi:hypothetical protein